METVLIDIRNDSFLSKQFEGKDFVSLNDIACAFEEAVYDVERLQEQIKDMEQDIQENYRRIPISELVDINDNYFH